MHGRAVELAGDEPGLELLLEADADIHIVAEMVGGKVPEFQFEGNFGESAVNLGIMVDSTCRPKATEQATFSRRAGGLSPMAETAAEASSSSCRMPPTRSR